MYSLPNTRETEYAQAISRLYTSVFFAVDFFPRKYDRHNGPPRSGFLPPLPCNPFPFTLTLLLKLLQASKSFGSLRPKFGMLCPTEL